MYSWKIVPISKNQKLDVKEEDLLENGLFRKCNTYRGGGGYDRFPVICQKRLGVKLAQQFIVQLRGCNLDCPYCYVTREGVWGYPVGRTSQELVSSFQRSNQEVFHLMGGAPALYLDYWTELIAEIKGRCPGKVFHSDLMLSEGVYKIETLKRINQDNCLYAINIKGLNTKEWKKNTRKDFNLRLFWANLRKVYESNLNCYFTFTGCNPDNLPDFFHQIKTKMGSAVLDFVQKDWFAIDLINYHASDHVDSIRWGESQQ